MRLTRERWFGLPTKWVGPGLAVSIVLLGTALLDMTGPGDRLAEIPDLVYDFELGAFGEAPSDRNVRLQIEKWAYNVRVLLRGEFKKGDGKKLRSYLAEVAKFTGLNFIHVEDDQGDFDLLIRVISDQQMNEIEDEEYERYKHMWARKRSLGCFVTSAKSRIRGTIYWAKAILRHDHVEYCGQHEIMHVLGFRGHFWRSDPSVLYVHEDTDDLSLNDKLLMRTLYDERIGPHMDRRRAVTAAREIIAELAAGVKRDGENSLLHPIYRHRTATQSDAPVSQPH